MLSQHIAHYRADRDACAWLWMGDQDDEPSHPQQLRPSLATGPPEGQSRKPETSRSAPLLRQWSYIAQGCDVVTVQRALGHATATVTLNTYSHLWPTAEDRTRRAAEEMLREALGAEDSADRARTGDT
jgi:integrase